MFPAAVLAADVAGTVDLLDRTELRLRTTQELNAPAGFPNTAQTNLGLDFFTQPTIRVNLLERRWYLEASYGPSFTFPELEQGFTPTVLQVGDVHASWHDRDTTLSATQAASYGQLNGAYLAPQSLQQPIPGQPPIVTATPQPVTIDYLVSRTVGALGVRLDAHDQMTASAEYDVVGGTNAVSRVTVPEQHGPRGNVTYEHIFDRRDAILTTALYQHTTFVGLLCLPPTGPSPSAPTGFPCTPDSHIFQAGEALRHRITRQAAISVGAGVAAAIARMQAFQSYGTTFYPTGQALISYDFPRPSAEAYGTGLHAAEEVLLASTLRISGTLAPVVDIRTGNVYNAVAADGSLVVPASKLVAFRAGGGVLQYVPSGSAGAVSLVHSEAEIDFAADRTVTFALGERGIWQQQNGFGTFLSSYGFLAVTLRGPRATF
jgi:hypothetical protein